MESKTTNDTSAVVTDKPLVSSDTESRLPASRQNASPAGYQLVKVRKPDGTIVEVKRRIPGASATAAKPASAAQTSAAASSTPGNNEPHAVSPIKAADATLQYQIVKVRKPDGTIINVRRPIPVKDAEPAPAAPLVAKQTQSVSTSTGAETTAPTISPAATAPAAASPKTTTTTTGKTLAKQGSASEKPQKEPPISTRKATDFSTEKAIPQSTVDDLSPPRKSGITMPSWGSFALKTISALHPSLDIGHMEDGDEALSDMDYDSDEAYDSDGNDDANDHDVNLHDANDAGDHNHHDDQDANHHEDHDTAQHDALASHAATGLISSTAGLANLPPAYSQRGGTAKGVQSNQAVSNNTEKTVQEDHLEKATKGPVVNEKELDKPEVASDVTPIASAKLSKTLSRRGAALSRYIIYALLMILPLLFIALGILIAFLKNRRTDSSYGIGVDQATKIAITAWPIVFAAVAAQSLRAFATYKVERGIKLMTLEQLINSSSVASSIKQPFLLRRFDLMSIALLCLWAMSPLASQALQRVYYPISINDKSTNTTAYFIDTRTSNAVLGSNEIYFEEGPNETKLYSAAIDMTMLLQSSLISRPTLDFAGTDFWLRPLIPVYEAVQFRPSCIDGWCPSFTTEYASNFGIVIEPFPYPDLRQSYEIVVPSSYLYFDCANLTRATMPTINASAIANNVTLRTTLESVVDIVNNRNWAGMRLQNDTAPGLYYYIGAIQQDQSSTNDAEYSFSVCNFTETFVDLNITCSINDQLESCSANYIRLTPNPPKRTPMIDFSLTFIDNMNPYLDAYLWNPGNLSDWIRSYPNHTIADDVPLITFRPRLERLFNSYWMLGFSPALQANGYDHNTTISGYPTDFVAATAVATISLPVNIYQIDAGWLAAIFICAVLLLLGGIMSVICDTQTIVPDILGFASSVARRSKYVDLPKTDSAMSGPERARLMGDVRVMMQDVKPAASVGRIALGSAHQSAQRLVPGRHYR